MDLTIKDFSGYNGVDNGYTSSASPEPEPKSDVDWRKQHVTTLQKLDHILQSNDFSNDVKFLVGDEKIYPVAITAHKFLLRLSSSVFEDLFRETERNASSDSSYIIDLPGVAPIAINCLLKYIYTNEIELEGLTVENIISIIRLAKKYEISLVPLLCFERLKEEIPVNDALDVLDIAKECQREDLEQAALAVILRNGKQILESPSFTQISYENAYYILQNDELAASEVSIFKAAYRWAEARCLSEEEKSPEAIRMKMGGLKNLVRYPLMTADEFALNVITSGILMMPERIEILQYISVSDSLKTSFVPHLFSIKPRVGLLNKNHHLNTSTQINPYDDSYLNTSLSTNLRHLLLQNCKVDLNHLVKNFTSSLNLKSRREIETLSLKNVILVNYEERLNHCVRLPNLKRFYLCLKTLPEDVQEELTISNIIQSQFERFLFFTKKAKHYPWPWPFSFLWSLGVDITLELNNVIFLKVDHEGKSLVINKLKSLKAILESTRMICSGDIRCLAIAFNAPHLSLPEPESIETLCLHHAHYISDNPSAYIGEFPNLSEVIVYQCEYKQIDLDIAIAAPDKLRTLAIGQASMKIGGSLFQSTTKSFSSLESLILWNCIWDEQFEEQFLTMFPNLKEIHVYNSFFDKPLYTFLSKIVELKHVEKIGMSGFMWGAFKSNASSTNEGVKMKYQVLNFLKAVGYKKNYYSFTLTKVQDGGRGLGQPWILYEIPDSEVWETMYHQFHFHRFYNTFQTFQDKYETE